MVKKPDKKIVNLSRQMLNVKFITNFTFFFALFAKTAVFGVHRECRIHFAPGDTDSTWALINLILAVGSIAIAIMFPYRAINRKIRRQEAHDTDAGNTGIMAAISRDQNLIWAITAIVTALAGAVIFLLTQNLTGKISLIDFWTILHAAIMAAQLIALLQSPCFTRL